MDCLLLIVLPDSCSRRQEVRGGLLAPMHGAAARVSCRSPAETPRGSAPTSCLVPSLLSCCRRVGHGHGESAMPTSLTGHRINRQPICEWPSVDRWLSRRPALRRPRWLLSPCHACACGTCRRRL